MLAGQSSPGRPFRGLRGRVGGAGENYCGGRRILGGSQPDPRGDLGGAEVVVT